MVQRLKTKDWGHGILSKQDQDYILALNSLANIAMKYKTDSNFETVAHYLTKYCQPIGFELRLDLWDEFEDYLYDENLLDLIDD